MALLFRNIYKLIFFSQSGYVCMAFYRRDGHVVELQTGSRVSRPEDACLPAHYQPRSLPFLTLVSEYSPTMHAPI